jgi:hypothetical protein
MSPNPPPGTAAPGRADPRPRPWRTRAILIGVIAFAAVTATALTAAAGSAGPARTRAVSVTAGPVAAVSLQAVPGQLTIVAAATGRVTLTGQLNWTGRAAATSTEYTAARVLRLSFRCATGSPCTANLRLVVPGRTAVTLRQPAGHVVISGLAGPLRIIASSVDVSAIGLRCPTVDAAITAGHLGASFDAAPRQVSIGLASAQATLWLPGSVGYAVTAQVAAGFVHVGVPQDASAPRAVRARIVSGELDLQPR